MSFFTRIRDAITAPVRVIIKADPLISRLTTGHFQGGMRGFRARTAAGVHEAMTDPIFKRLGIREKDVTNIVVIAAIVVATYFTAGAASSAMGTTWGAAYTAAAGASGYVKGALSIYTIAEQHKKQQQAKREAEQAAQAAQSAAAMQAQADALPQKKTSLLLPLAAAGAIAVALLM